MKWIPTSALLVMLFACGGMTVAEDAGSEATATPMPAEPPNTSVSLDAAITTCPINPPTAGARCPTNFGSICEYGGKLSPTCDELFQCASDACSNTPPTWRQIGLTSTCPKPTPAGCPTSFDVVEDAGACKIGTRCAYSAGVCQCQGPGWKCIDAPANCPKQRPRLGTPCNEVVAPDQVCPFEFDQISFGPSCFSNGYLCVAGVWSVSFSCALPPPPC